MLVYVVFVHFVCCYEVPVPLLSRKLLLISDFDNSSLIIVQRAYDQNYRTSFLPTFRTGTSFQWKFELWGWIFFRPPSSGSGSVTSATAMILLFLYLTAMLFLYLAAMLLLFLYLKCVPRLKNAKVWNTAAPWSMTAWFQLVNNLKVGTGSYFTYKRNFFFFVLFSQGFESMAGPGNISMYGHLLTGAPVSKVSRHTFDSSH